MPAACCSVNCSHGECTDGRIRLAASGGGVAQHGLGNRIADHAMHCGSVIKAAKRSGPPSSTRLTTPAASPTLQPQVALPCTR